MKKPTYSFSLLTMTILLAWLTLAVTGTANAKWLCIHGHSGQIEDESALEKIGRRGWGLDCDMKDNSATWVHLAVPSLKRNNSIRFLRVQYYTNNAEVTELEVYNGSHQEVQMKELPWYWKTPGGHNIKLNLSSPISSQNGLCISMKVDSSKYPKNMRHRFLFRSAQADFDESGLITWYVDDHSEKPYPGYGTKSNPFHEIKMAIDAAWSGDTVKVAAGTYYENITLKSGVTVLGAGEDVTSIVGGGIGDDSWDPVVTAIDVDFAARLEGFTITTGYPGMYNVCSSPAVANCRFTINRHGMINVVYSNPIVTNCIFSTNVADDGGAMRNVISNPYVANCTFENNEATIFGGAVYNYNCSPTLYKCVFRNNSAYDENAWRTGATTYGGGMYNEKADPWLISCTFVDNSSCGQRGDLGGGMYNCNNSSPYLTNCIFWRNVSSNGGGMFNDNASPYVTNCTFYDNWSQYVHGRGMHNDNGSSATVTNCIFWNDRASGWEEIYVNDSKSSASVTYSNVQGGYLGGTGNMNLKPMFVDPYNGDFHLKLGSPCIDKGTNNPPVPAGWWWWWGEDFEGDPRVFDYNGSGIADMGADEFSPPLVTVYPFGG